MPLNLICTKTLSISLKHNRLEGWMAIFVLPPLFVTESGGCGFGPMPRSTEPDKETHSLCNAEFIYWVGLAHGWRGTSFLTQILVTADTSSGSYSLPPACMFYILLFTTTALHQPETDDLRSVRTNLEPVLGIRSLRTTWLGWTHFPLKVVMLGPRRWLRRLNTCFVFRSTDFHAWCLQAQWEVFLKHHVKGVPSAAGATPNQKITTKNDFAVHIAKHAAGEGE